MRITAKHVGIGLIASLPFLGGCSMFGKPVDPPAPLVEFKPSLSVKPAWEADIGKAGQYQFSPAIVGNHVFVAAANGNLAKLDGANGNTLWKIDVGSHLTAGVGADENTVAVVASKGVVKAFDPSGKARWSAQASSDVLSPPAVLNGLVIVRSIDNRIDAYDEQSGKLRWTLQRPLPALALEVAPRFLAEGPLIVLGMTSGRLLALSTATGAVTWDAQVAEPRGATEIERIVDIPGTPALNGPEICAASYQGKLTCFATSNGAPAWSRDFSTHVGIALDNNAVYAVDEKSHVFAFSASNGQNLWKNDQFSYRRFSSPLETSKAIVMGDLEGQVHFLSPETGALMARIATDGSPILATPTLLGNDILIQTQKGHLYALKVE